MNEEITTTQSEGYKYLEADGLKARDSVIRARLEELDKTLSHLHEVTNILANTLEPVRRVSNETSKSDTDNPVPDQSEITNRIIRLTSEANTIARLVTNIQQELEI